MFLYWDGYEIDGSDTSFDIILPENIQAKEFVETFLSIPIFSKSKGHVYKSQTPMWHYRGYVDSENRITQAEFEELLLSGHAERLSVMAHCLHPEELGWELRAQIYGLSEGRIPHEEAYGKTANPCVAPNSQNAFMTVVLTIGTLQIDDGEYYWNQDAYSYNKPLMPPKKGETMFWLEIPVSSNYEYAMYIIKHMEEHFPSIRLWGGRECSCGATFGTSLYGYEKIHMPIKHSIKNTLKRLTEYGILRSCYYAIKTGEWLTVFAKRGFYLSKNDASFYAPSEDEVSLDEYLGIVDLALSMELDYYGQVHETAIKIHLPPPEFYDESLDVAMMLDEKLETAVPYETRKSWYNKDLLFDGFVAFVLVDGKPACEFRVRYQMKDYLQSLLALAESGLLDFAREKTYKCRKEA